MRRSIVSLSLLAAAVAAIWGLGVVGPAGAASPAPRIVCPMESPLLTSCCPPPMSGANMRAQSVHAQPDCCPGIPCCQGTTCCEQAACCPSGSTSTSCSPPSLTIAASPDPSTAGRRVVISGTLTGSAAAGATVELWRKLANQTSFQPFGQSTTDSSGAYSFTVAHVMADQQFYTTSEGAQSSTIAQRVRALVSIVSSTRGSGLGPSVTLSGRVTPSHARQMLLIEQQRGAVWHVIARVRLSRHSRYMISATYTPMHTVRLRAVLPGDGRNMRSVSPSLLVKPAS